MCNSTADAFELLACPYTIAVIIRTCTSVGGVA